MSNRVIAIRGTDPTTCVTAEDSQAFLLFAVDPCSTECTGIHAARNGTCFEALEPIRPGGFRFVMTTVLTGVGSEGPVKGGAALCGIFWGNAR